MRAFFEGIQWLFENIFFWPQDHLRELELTHWFAANIINWIFMIICTLLQWYWCKQLTIASKKRRRKPRYNGTFFLN
jgi:hypothetical protein